MGKRFEEILFERIFSREPMSFVSVFGCSEEALLRRKHRKYVLEDQKATQISWDAVDICWQRFDQWHRGVRAGSTCSLLNTFRHDWPRPAWMPRRQSNAPCSANSPEVSFGLKRLCNSWPPCLLPHPMFLLNLRLFFFFCFGVVFYKSSRGVCMA